MKTLGYSPWASSPEPFNVLFEEQRNLLQHSMDGCDAIVLWGGTDINPRFYGQKPHPLTWHEEDSQRDRKEWEWLHEAIERNVPIIGVCRGAQLLCASAGGSLFQHITGHQGAHPITTNDGRVYQQPSAHHQMLNLGALPKDEYELLAWSTKNLSKRYEDEHGIYKIPEEFKEPEVVYFPKIRGLAIQSHPEWCSVDDPFNLYVFELVNKLLLKETV